MIFHLKQNSNDTYLIVTRGIKSIRLIASQPFLMATILMVNFFILHYADFTLDLACLINHFLAISMPTSLSGARAPINTQSVNDSGTV